MKIDSLLNQLSSQRQLKKEDTMVVRLLNVISWQCYTQSAYDTAHYYAREALSLAEKLGDKKGRATAMRYIGNCYAEQKDSANALKYYDRAFQISEQMGDKQGMINNLSNIAILFSDYSDFNNAVTYYQQVINIAQEIKDTALILNNYMNLSHVYISQFNYPLALENFQNTLSLSEKTKKPQISAEVLFQISNIYRMQGSSSKIINYLQKSLQVYRQLNDKSGITKCLFTLANTYQNMGNLDTAEKYYLKSIDLYKELENDQGLATTYANVVVLYEQKLDFRTAYQYLEKSDSLFLKYPNDISRIICFLGKGYFFLSAPDSFLATINVKPGSQYDTTIHYGMRALSMSTEYHSGDLRRQSMWILFNSYKKKGDYKNAFYWLEKTWQLQDSLAGEATQKAIVRKEVQFEYEKKTAIAEAAHEKEALKQRTIRNTLLAGLFLLIIFSIFVISQRNKTKKEKKRSDRLLLNILPEEVAEELKAKGSAEAKQFDKVSVLFTDFVHFTQTTELLSPQELVQELNTCFTAFDHIIERNGLEKIKTIGDAYLAVCGLPAADPRHAQKTVQAALDIRNFIAERKKTEKAFEIRIGVHSGSVVAGIVGVKKFAYDIWGDTVNTAARMEQSGEPGKVNISGVTYELVKHDFDCTYRGEVEAKNKGKLKMYFVRWEQKYE